jgi:hypothetical protein
LVAADARQAGDHLKEIQELHFHPLEIRLLLGSPPLASFMRIIKATPDMKN